MQFSVNRKQFVSALSACATVVEKRTTIPILTGVKITLGPTNFATVVGTDLEIAVQRAVPIFDRSSEERFETVIPLPILQKFLGASKADTVLFDFTVLKCSNCEGAGSLPGTDDPATPLECTYCKGTGQVVPPYSTAVKIAAGATITIDTFAAESFPDLPAIGTEDFPVIRLLDITADAWIDMTEKCKFAISADESRFTLNGFLLEVSDKVRMVSTDGHRLCCIERGDMPEGTKAESALIPKRLADILKKVLGKSTDTVTVLLTKLVVTDKVTEVRSVSEKNGDYLVFICGGTVVISRLLTGNFPDYKRVLCSYTAEPARVGAEAFINAIDGVKHCSDDRSRAIRISFNCESLTVYAETHEKGKAHMDVPCRTGAAHGVNVGFNYDYLLDLLKSFSKLDVVTIRCNSTPEAVKVDEFNVPIDEDTEEKAEERRTIRAEKSAWEFRSTADSGARTIIMPMRR